jgi:hypothetical protein
MSKRRAVQVGRSSTEYLDVVSYGRRGPAVPDEFSVAQIEKIRLTVHRAPEVMVKVSGGGRDAGAVAAHFAYLGRSGKFEIETDDGRLLTGSGAAREIVEDWNLDAMPATRREARTGRPAPKQVHNIVLSMPRKTDPQKLLAAARAFAEGEFAERHRYAMVLHTDQQHPHVHFVVKAVDGDGERLYVRKQTLREWREHFAEELRARGIAANATHRAVRGAMRTHKKDGIRRAIARGGSTHLEARLRAVAEEIRLGTLAPGPGKAKLAETRRQVLQGWQATAEQLQRQGEKELGKEVEHFSRWMPPPRTEKEALAASLLHRIRAPSAERRQRTPDPPARGR